MEIFKKFLAGIAALSLVLGFGGLMAALAATTPSLGIAASYSILSSTYTNTTAGTTISGDIGFTTGPAVVPGGVHTNYGSGAPYSTAGTDQGSALTSLNGQACTFTFASGAIDLATDTTHGTIRIYTPGVYCISGAASIGTAGITLDGAGTYVFRITGALTSVANSSVSLTNGASSCDVFWTPVAATTLGANSTFAGTDINAAGITLGSNVTWNGRALAFGGTVTTAVGDTITVPTCSISTPTPTPSATPTPTPTPSVTPTPSITPTPPSTPSATPTPTPTPVPGLPSTGIPPDNNDGIPWNIIILSGVLVTLASFYLVRRKQATEGERSALRQ